MLLGKMLWGLSEPEANNNRRVIGCRQTYAASRATRFSCDSTNLV